MYKALKEVYVNLKFKPSFQITSKIARNLMQIEALRERIQHLTLAPELLSELSKMIKLLRVRYSTMIEGGHSLSSVDSISTSKVSFSTLNEQAAKGYYAALTQVEKWIAEEAPCHEKMILKLYELAIESDSPNKSISYREGQSLIYNTRTKAIVYMPPEAKEIAGLVKALVNWIKENEEIPSPIVAAIANYQLTSIHPFYAGNGRVARLLATLILGLNKYDLRGLYVLEEYYVNNLNAYFEALSVSPLYSYCGLEECNITPWIQYFVEGLAFSYENVLKRASSLDDKMIESLWQNNFDAKQLKAISLFQEFVTIKASDLSKTP